MNKPDPKQKQAGRLPAKGAKAALLTKNGAITGVLASWSDDGAVIDASGEGLAGSEVCLRVQGPDKIWEKRATVLWVNGQSVGLDFEPDRPAKKGLLQRAFDSMRSPTADKPTASQSPVEKERRDIRPVEKRETSTDMRHRRRIRIETPAEVIRLDSAGAGPDITTIMDASSSGVLFTTDRGYSVGTKLLVKYPYPDSSLPRQAGIVVRVERLPDGRRRVAVAFAPAYENPGS